MVVLNELKKSIKLLEQATKDLGKISTFGELDEYEIKTQKIVFNLQMQANQVAGELVPVIAAKRTNMRNDSAKNALERIKAVQEKAVATAQPEVEEPKTEEVKVEEPKVEEEDSKVEEPKTEEVKVEEPKVEDGGDSDRQSESNAGDSKPKSTKKTK